MRQLDLDFSSTQYYSEIENEIYYVYNLGKLTNQAHLSVSLVGGMLQFPKVLEVVTFDCIVRENYLYQLKQCSRKSRFS